MRASIVSCVDASPFLELGEHVLDAVSLSIEGFVVAMLDDALLERRDAGGDAALGEAGPEGVAVIAAIRDQG